MICVGNRNVTQRFVDVKLMLMIGGTTSRGLTGQGFGTKFVGVKAAVDGIRFARASWDKEGKYIAWYEVQPYMLGDTESLQAVLVVQRPDRPLQRLEMTVDTNMVGSAWANHLMGDDYPSIREMILDAADEDHAFTITERELDYAPPGYTYTYIEKRPKLADILDYPRYYFRRADEITWLNDYVGVATLSALNEARMFVTAEGAPVAYAAYTTGLDEDDFTPDPAYDYVLKETHDQTWVSMPKRILENSASAMNTITKAIMACQNVDVVYAVLRNVLDGGFEKDWKWDTSHYAWHRDTLREALNRIVGGRPIHSTKQDELYAMAILGGHKPFVLPEWLYDLGNSFCGLTTIANVLMIRDKDELVLEVPTPSQRAAFGQAIRALEEQFPYVNWRGHVYMNLDAEVVGVHKPKGTDVIGVNFDKTGMDIRKIAKVIIHEHVHHLLNQDSEDNNWHYNGFQAQMLEMLMPPTVE